MEAACTSNPTLVQDDLDVSQCSGVGQSYEGKPAGGFVTDGRVIYGDWSLLQ